MIVQAFAARGVELTVVDDRRIGGDLAAWPGAIPECDVVLLRSKSQWRNSILARWLEDRGGHPVNSSHVIDTCGDKARTTLALLATDVPTLTASIAFTPEAGIEVADDIGYPLVVKPVIGSWGRLIGKVNDPDALQLALEHKEALGGAPHAVTYLQTFVETGGSDIRAFVIEDRCVAAITRRSSGWRTNTALGASAEGRSVDDALEEISTAAARAVGGGMVAVDLFVTDDGYLVNEVNATMEFRNSIETTGVDIPGLMADAVLGVLEGVNA